MQKNQPPNGTFFREGKIVSGFLLTHLKISLYIRTNPCYSSDINSEKISEQFVQISPQVIEKSFETGIQVNLS